MDPKYNFLMTGLGFRGMPNWASHTHPGGQNEETGKTAHNVLSYCCSLQEYKGLPGGASSKEPTCQFRLDVKDAGLIPGLGRSPGGGHSNPLQYSRLENPMDRSLAGCSP